MKADALITNIVAATSYLLTMSTWSQPSSLKSDGNDRLQPGEELWSPSGRAVFAAEKNGNLVVYHQVPHSDVFHYDRGNERRALWSSNTDGKHLDRVQMNSNGELVAFSDGGGGNFTWKSGQGN
jgi:hypothetical protein